MKNRAAAHRLPPTSSPTAPPLGALGVALLLGALAALLPSSGHVHSGGHGSWAHQHFFAGPHSHAAAPAQPGSPLPEEPPPERDSQVVALALALTLDAAAPALLPVAATPFRPLPVPAPALPRGAALASPFSPRGPPALPC